MESDNLSFSKDVADTIGVEAAVILKFIEDNKISSSSIEDIAEIILEKFSFMEEKKIVSSIEKIAGLGLIKIKSDKFRRVQLKLPRRSRSDKSNVIGSTIASIKNPLKLPCPVTVSVSPTTIGIPLVLDGEKAIPV